MSAVQKDSAGIEPRAWLVKKGSIGAAAFTALVSDTKWPKLWELMQTYKGLHLVNRGNGRVTALLLGIDAVQEVLQGL